VILDTNALSAMAENEPGIDSLLLEAEQLAVPAIVLGEFLHGIGQSRHRRKYEDWLEGMLRDVKLLPVGARTARAYAAIRTELKRSGRPIPANDLWIAALAREHAMPVISRDKHFDLIPRLERVGW
jgi:predicted nucleic acid-binding protein